MGIKLCCGAQIFIKSSFLYYGTIGPDFLPDAVPFKSFKKKKRTPCIHTELFPWVASSLHQDEAKF